MSKWFMCGTDVYSSELATLAQMNGKMQWLAAYGNLPSEKAYRLAVKAAVVSMIFLPVWLGVSIVSETMALNISGGFFMLSFLLLMTLPFPYFAFAGKQRILEKMQEASWQYDPTKRILTHLENSETMMKYAVSNHDHLYAIRWQDKHYKTCFTLEYRRPYPAPYVPILKFIFCKPSDKNDFVTAAQNIARQMNLPLDERGL